MIRDFFRSTVSFLLVLCLFVSVPSSFAAESSKTSSPASSSATPDGSAAKKKEPAKRLSPLQTLFDQSQAQVEAVADSIEYQKDANKVVARGNAVLTYKNLRLLADYAEVETTSKKAYAKGHVLIFEDDKPMIKANEVFYDFENHSGSSPEGRAYSDPIFARGKEVKQVKEGVLKVKDGGVTTCNLENPHYEIRCKRATLYTGEKIRMYNATVYVLGKPMFWWPYIVLPLNWNVPFQATAGYTTEYGGYIELTKGITFNKHLYGRWHADWRAKRGFGGGWDQDYDFGKYATGDVKLYWTQDKEAPTPGYRSTDTGNGKTTLDPYAQREDRDRGRITWRHRTDINDYTNIIARYHRVADEYFMQDFMENEYRSEMEPHSFVTGTHNSDRYGLMIHSEKRMNGFESIVERLPEVRLDWKNQPIFRDMVYNASRLQVDNLTKKFSRESPGKNAVRVDGYSRIFAPAKYKDIKFTPMLGYRGTEYSRDDYNTQPHYRQVLEYSADLRTQAYRTMNVTFNKMGIEINQLRHIFEPSVRVQGQASSLQSINRLTHFDTIDTIDSSSEIVFGVDNRLQTKRMLHGKAQRVDLVSLNTYVHYALKSPDPSATGGGLTLVTNELTLRPYEWLQFQHRMEIDLSGNYLKLCNNDIVIRRGRWRFLFGQRYVHNYWDYLQAMDIPKAQQFVFDTQYKLNDLWSIGGYIRWDTSEGNLQEWQVAATRDLHDFLLDFGFNTRNSLIDSKNQQLFFSLRMKAFPQMNLRGGGGHASFSEPRIGETVAGASQERGFYSMSSDQQFWGIQR